MKVQFQSGFHAQCREGFEPELAVEFGALAQKNHSAVLGTLSTTEPFPSGWVKAVTRSGYASFVFNSTVPPLARPGSRALRNMVFPRQMFFQLAHVRDLPEEKKADPLAQAIVEILGTEPVPSFALEAGAGPEILLEAPDTNDGKELLAFCRTFGPHLKRALVKALAAAKMPAPAATIHVFFTGWRECTVGLALPRISSPSAQGILRLRFPGDAPSRSTLKLEEAFLTLLNTRQQETLLSPGLTAVDLGASPGGWTYQFTQREMHVVAVDNGNMDPALLATGLVEHRREDGFRFRPRKPVMWMVCDMVEQPVRVARLAADWIREGQASHTMFNLKLPMKARYAEVERCLSTAREALEASGVAHLLRARHLYHDREEVTCYLGLSEARPNR